MPPAICNDSEDEEEVLVEDEYPSQRSRSSNVSYNAAIDFANEVLSGSPGLDGANDRSSLSAGAISRQIADTTRGFFSSTTDSSKMVVAPSSSAKSKLSRRHTNLSGTVTGTSPSKVSKRTLTTYGKSSAKSQRAPKGSSDEAFSAYNNDERASQESLSAEFLRKSETPKSTMDGLPAGTILQNFHEHDPHVLFPDTGSTIVNNESSMQRMLEMAREPVRQPLQYHKTHIVMNDSQTQHSSPFAAWSASDKQTQTPKIAANKDSPLRPSTASADQSADGEPSNGPAGNTAIDKLDNASSTVSAAAHKNLDVSEASVVESETQQQQGAKTEPYTMPDQEQAKAILVSEQSRNASKSQVPPRSSPMVIIPPTETPHLKHSNKSTQKSSKSKKRNSVDAELDDAPQHRPEPLNSDDRAIGLPKELYKPRPSRRRATAIVEPIDYSAVPEKALKKRRKTMDHDVSGVGADGEMPQSSARSTQRASVKTPALAPSTRRNPGQDEDADMQAAIAASLRDLEQSAGGGEVESHKDPRATPPVRPARGKSPEAPVASPLSPPAKPEGPTRSATKSASTSQKIGCASPVKMLPPTLPASATRKTPRRSQTTIFEDHAAQRSPSLSQQQATRLAAVKGLPDFTQTNKRKRRTIVQTDEDDEEDELSKEPPAQKPAAKERGRPPKAASGASKVKASQKAPRDSEDEGVILENECPVETAQKTKAAAAATADFETDGHEDVVKSSSKNNKKCKSSARILQDSEDELDTQDEAVAVVKAASKKAPGQSRKSAAKVLDDSGEEPTMEEDEDDDLEMQPKPKKKPGRPFKKQAKVVDTVELAQATKEPLVKAVLEPKDGNANAAVAPIDPRSKEATPVPHVAKAISKPDTKHTTPAPDVKPSPNSHSPIKKNGKVIHRVGLGRRQRVQPLLKMIRPDAKARKEDATRVTTVTSVAELEKKWNEVPE
ncbi:Putative ubiquitin interacting [Septoria linicola]|uniref:Ubiquitin interacting n=1 Tax=Septoria linicola TaxID=215465 RepID=A0A9Q9EPW6_9PEZI|nr:putative ubiquitin interacting [Septoria linicola]USW56943.1 Putative ubiquitin interacting [Septoria linicola]